MNGFRPFGMSGKDPGVVFLQFDEFESINLVNYMGLSQEEASIKMDVSRPTFTRIYNKALQKIARAFVEGLSIEIEGGKVDFGRTWYKCLKCYRLIEGLENHVKCQGCPRYAGSELIQINQ